MTAITSQPTAARNPRPIRSFAQRLGIQALMSVTVMAGLQFASVNGYDVRDLMPDRAPGAAGPSRLRAEPTEVSGVPVRFDLPVQAGSALDHIGPAVPPDAAAAGAQRPLPAPRASAAIASAPTPAPLVAALSSAGHVAVPTPRPRPIAARPAAVPPRPSEVPFDVTPRDVEVYGVAELLDEDAPPEPLVMADGGFGLGDLVPSGSAILRRTADVTGSAAQVVTGTATRILDLVR